MLGKHSSLIVPYVSYEENEVTYEWVECFKKLGWNGLLGKHSSLIVPNVSYEENEVLWILSLGQYSQHFIFFITYEWVECFKKLVWNGLPGNNTLA